MMPDRPTLTMRTLTVAALYRAVFRAGSGGASELPDVVCGDAGALVAGYERGVVRLRARQRIVRSARAPRCGASTRSWD